MRLLSRGASPWSWGHESRRNGLVCSIRVPSAAERWPLARACLVTSTGGYWLNGGGGRPPPHLVSRSTVLGAMIRRLPRRPVVLD